MPAEYIIKKIVRRGLDHNDFCEDFLAVHEDDNFIVGAVMDGCSNGIHSHFASSFFGKLFNLLMRTRNILDECVGMDVRSVAWRVMFDFCRALQFYMRSLQLSSSELMSTLVLAVYSKQDGSLIVIPFGDGYVHVNGVGYWIENKRFPDTMVDGKLIRGKDLPDYLIYDIDIFDFNDQDPSVFDEWFSKKEHLEFKEGVSDFTISTDGIYTFRDKKKNDLSKEVISLMMDDKEACGGIRNLASMPRKMNLINHPKEDGSVPLWLDAHNIDDVSMVRVIVEPMDSVPEEKETSMSEEQ